MREAVLVDAVNTMRVGINLRRNRLHIPSGLIMMKLRSAVLTPILLVPVGILQKHLSKDLR